MDLCGFVQDQPGRLTNSRTVRATWALFANKKFLLNGSVTINPTLTTLGGVLETPV